MIIANENITYGIVVVSMLQISKQRRTIGSSITCINLQDEDRRRKLNLTVLRGHKLSANADLRTPAGSHLAVGLTQTGHGATSTTMETTSSGVVPHGVMLPRSLLPPISHKRDISSANINRPLPVSVCYVHIILSFWIKFWI